MSKHDKLMADFHRLLKTQNFKDEDDLKKFMEYIGGQPIPSFEKEALSLEEIAEDLVMEAYELRDERCMMKIMEALEFDADCIMAYELLGSLQPFPQLALPFYAYGVEIGRKKFKQMFIDSKGHFWGMIETRPFMRCMREYATCLYLSEKCSDALDVFKEILELNPRDNQGIRYEYGLLLINVTDFKSFEKLDKSFDYEDATAACFNRALNAFVQHKDSELSRDLLKKAIAKNKFVLQKLIAKNPPAQQVSSYGLGTKEEAVYYASFAWKIWNDFPEAIQWLRKNK